MKVAALYDRQFQVEERPLPTIGPGEILLKVKACGLCGTDVLKIKAGLEAPGIVLGHEIVGIAERADATTGFSQGDRLVVAHHVPCGACHYCRHGNESMCLQFKQTNLDPGGFAEYLRIPKEHARKTCFKVPENLSDQEALFMEPLACCLRAVQRSALLPGDTALVVGLGCIGLMLTQVLVSQKVRVIARDLQPERVNLAVRLGAVTDPGDNVDMVLFTGGTSQVFQESLGWIRPGGKLHLFAELSGEPISFPFAELYHRELTILSTYSSSPQTLKESLELLAKQVVTPKAYGWQLYPLGGLPQAVTETTTHQVMKAIVVPT